MQEARSGVVKLEHADAGAVKSILAMLHTDGHAFSELDLSASEMLKTICQAAEWQCTSLVQKLLAIFIERVSSVDGSIAAQALRLADQHKTVEAAGTKIHELWEKCWAAAVKQVSSTCCSSGNFPLLQELPFDTFLEVIRSDELDTDKSEGKVLQAVVQWVQKENLPDKLPQLLKAVRFPLIPAADLLTEFKGELRYARQCGSGDVVDQLHGEAVHVQLQRKHKRTFADAFDAGDDSDAKRRLKSRKNSGEFPVLSHSDLAKTLSLGGGI
jgi:hypothetical protein